MLVLWVIEMTDACIVLCTCADMQSATAIASRLVENKLAACVNLVPNLISIYRWQDKIEQDAEVQMLIKTRRALTEKALQLVEKFHPYDTPEWLVLNVDAGGKDYLQWISQNTNEVN